MLPLHLPHSLDVRSLPTRLIVSFVAVIVLATLVVGVPALRLIEEALARQVDARLVQGSSATEALYAAHLREMQALVTLSAERPTLQRLLEAQDAAALPAYLETIRETAGLDGLGVVDASGTLLAQAPVGARLPPFLSLTTSGDSPTIRPLMMAERPALASVATALVQTADGALLGAVVGVNELESAFLMELYHETGLHHTLYQDGERIVGTLPAFPPQQAALPEEQVRVGGEPFYLAALPLRADNAQVVDMLALPARELTETRNQVLQVLAGSLILLTMLAALLAYLLARHITAPLHHLVRASEGMGRGDLVTPIWVRRSPTEVATLAHTLEQMRQRLQSAQDELQRAKGWSENLIASLSEGVVTVDATGRLTSFSPGAERILGWEASEVIGRPAARVFRVGVGSEETEGITPLTTPGTVTRQSVVNRAGQPLTLLVTSGATTARRNGSWEQAYVFRDVTEEEKGLRLREFLLANVSHEFKTPLAALHAAVELLATELPSLTQAEQRELVSSVWLGTLRLEELVDNLLSSASLHTGHFVVRPRPTEVEEVIEEVLLATRPLLAGRGQWLKVEAPSPLRPVLADPRRLNQVLVNLISNASKYGPSGTPLALRVQEEPGWLRVAVSDSGPGVPPALQSHLFQPFSRQEEAGRSGIGLGLSIVKAIVERHGGSVGLENNSSGGATFWFTLPTQPQKDDP